MQQAAHLNRTLTNEQLQNANPLLGRHGILKIPDRKDPKQYPDGFVAICAIVKNQHQDLREWLEYHKWLGVSKVYVYDNNSTVPLLPDIIDMVQSGYVEYSYFTGTPRYRDLFRTSSQWWAYNDCVTRFKHRHRWLAFVDADEFIVLQGAAGADNINDFMRGYDQYGGLALNWVVFGSSGHKQRPQGGVLVNYRQCLPLQQEQNQHVKVIANTAHLMTIGDNPHRVYYNDMKRFGTVNELGAPVPGPKSPPSHTKVALYHYLTKSEDEYMQKMRRGSAAGNYKSPEFFTAINGLATERCTGAVPLGLKCCPSVVAELGAEGVARVKAGIAADQAAAAAGGGR
ncbi:glycosyltransferase family 92-domain-containing protein [Scenedesmus sp. NREL 46B-D3]|nr:glycosyltransferase family 92-domain-containing protein [Scenedesmus sp. NREL 46B-D3]